MSVCGWMREHAGAGVGSTGLLGQAHRPLTAGASAAWGLTYKVLLGVIPEVQQALGDGLAVLLPLACAEDHLREVPHPADDRDVGQLLLGQDLGALRQRRGPGQGVRERGVGIVLSHHHRKRG